MIIYKEADKLHQKIQLLKNQYTKIAFVPTMGALHHGHISLIEQAKRDNAFIISSIFVNPTQFNNAKDFEQYPITIEKDIELLEQSQCDILFLPSVAEIYPKGTNNLKHYDLGFIETVYDGAFRPGHFQGVCNVVQRLFEIITPTDAYFGLKDYQQCMVIQKLVELMQWEQKLQLHFCTTLREEDGLAMSSRNMRLNIEERKIAPLIYKTLLELKSELKKDSLNLIIKKAKNQLLDAGFKPDYLDIANAKTLEPITEWDGEEKLVCLVAAFLNEIRLIDNIVLN